MERKGKEPQTSVTGGGVKISPYGPCRAIGMGQMLTLPTGIKYTSLEATGQRTAHKMLIPKIGVEKKKGGGG